MRIEVVSAHAEGEVGDVIISGVDQIPGETIWEQSRFIANDQSLRKFILNEPVPSISLNFSVSTLTILVLLDMVVLY